MRRDVLGVRVDDISLAELHAYVRAWVSSGTFHWITTPNPEIVLSALDKNEFLSVLNQSDLSLPDGVGLSYAAAALDGKELEYRTTGVDAMLSLLSLANDEGYSVLLFGGEGVVPRKTLEVIRLTFPNLKVEHVEIGELPYGKDFVLSKFDNLKSKKGDIAFVALGAEKQEYFIKEVLKPLGIVSVALTVGGAFDMIAGVRKRAPKFLRIIGVEWAWRLLIEPRRWRRIFRATLVFPFYVVFATLERKRFIKACFAVLQVIFKTLWKKSEHV